MIIRITDSFFFSRITDYKSQPPEVINGLRIKRSSFQSNVITFLRFAAAEMLKQRPGQLPASSRLKRQVAKLLLTVWSMASSVNGMPKRGHFVGFHFFLKARGGSSPKNYLHARERTQNQNGTQTATFVWHGVSLNEGT